MASILRNLFINRVAHVDKGAGEGVEVVLMKNDAGEASDYTPEFVEKRDFSEKRRKELASRGFAMKDGSFPIENEEDLHNAVRAIGRAKNPEAAKAHIKERARAMGLESALPDSWRGIEKQLTLWRGADGSVTLEHRPEPGETSANLSGAPLEDEKDGKKKKPTKEKPSRRAESKNLKKSIETIFADATVTDKRALVLKSVDEFEDWFEKAVTEGVTIKGADPAGGGAHNQEAVMAKENDHDEDDKKEMEKKLAKALADLSKSKFDLAVAKMSAEDRDYLEKACATDDEKKEFAEADTEKRAAIRKSRPVNKALPEDVQKKLDELDAVKKSLAAIEKRERDAAFEKRASDMGFEPAFGETLQKAYSGDADSIAKVENEIKALRKQIAEGKLFSNFGSQSAKSGSALEKLHSLADELRKTEKKLTREQAFAKVFEDPANAEIAKLYRAERRAAN